MARSNAEIPGMATAFIQACVAGRPRLVHLNRSLNEYSFRMEEGPDLSEAIEALTVPQLAEKAGMNCMIDLLKCDVEGAEAEVFAGCADWINRVRYLAVEVHAPYTSGALLAHLKNAGVTPAWIEIVNKGDVGVVFMQCNN
jgi:FkbM family methyltransferase